MDQRQGDALSEFGCTDRPQRGFFFDQYFSILRSKPQCRYFFEPPKFRSSGLDSAKEREAQLRAENHNETVFKRIGWWQLIHLLFDKGWPSKQSMEAAYFASFENAARFVSRENAGL